MNNTVLIIIALIIIVGGGGYFYTQSQNAPQGDGDKMMEEGDSMTHDGDSMEKGDAMEKKDGDAMMEEGDKDSSGEAMQEADVVFDVTGKNFSFSETEIRVKKGQKVTVNFTSESGFHDWVVDEFGAATDRVNSGGKTSVTFTADQTGSFEYYCSVGSHRQLGMVGTLIVE